MTLENRPWIGAERYPDPAFEILNPAFEKYRLDAAAVERLYTGARWSEGPVWIGDGRYLLWSDIPNDRVLRWHETTGSVDVFRSPSGFANGQTRDRQGRIVFCEQLGRRVMRIEHDGALTVLADRFEGRRLNSPMTSSSSRTDRSGSPIRRTGSSAFMRARRPKPNSAPTSTVSTERQARSRRWWKA